MATWKGIPSSLIVQIVTDLSMKKVASLKKKAFLVSEKSRKNHSGVDSNPPPPPLLQVEIGLIGNLTHCDAIFAVYRSKDSLGDGTPITLLYNGGYESVAGTFKPLPFADQNFGKISDPLQTNSRKHYEIFQC